MAQSDFSSVTQSCPTLCNPMNHRMPGLPVHHQLPESIQTHVHLVDDAIQPYNPLSSPSPSALNLSSIRVFSKSALCIRWPKCWSFNLICLGSNQASVNHSHCVCGWFHPTIARLSSCNGNNYSWFFIENIC